MEDIKKNIRDEKKTEKKCMKSSSEIHRKKWKELSWRWLSKGVMKVQTDSLLCATQEQVLRTSYLKFYIDKTANSAMCRMCGNKGETVQHLICECEKLAQKEYKRRHVNVAKRLHWDLCMKIRLKCYKK